MLLGYIISAFYPLCLIGLTWVCIELYSHNFKLFVWSWNLVNKCLKKQVKRDSKTTIIDAFSSFLLLSYSKRVQFFVLNITPYSVRNMNSLPTRRVLWVDPNISWLSTGGLPFIVVSVFLFVVLVLPPVVLLTFYPVRIFRSLLFKCTFGGYRTAALNFFVETFHNSYRNGLDGGRDMRGLASLYFILRIIVYSMVFTEQFLIYSSLVIGGAAIIIAIFKPYNKSYMNIIDILLLSIMSFIAIIFYLHSQESAGSSTSLSYLLVIGLVGSLPMWGLLSFLAYKIIPQRILARIKQGLPFYQLSTNKKMNNGYDTTQRRNVDENRCDGRELPDRILNPEQYEGEITPMDVQYMQYIAEGNGEVTDTAY